MAAVRPTHHITSHTHDTSLNLSFSDYIKKKKKRLESLVASKYLAEASYWQHHQIGILTDWQHHQIDSINRLAASSDWEHHQIGSIIRWRCAR